MLPLRAGVLGTRAAGGRAARMRRVELPSPSAAARAEAAWAKQLAVRTACSRRPPHGLDVLAPSCLAARGDQR